MIVGEIQPFQMSDVCEVFPWDGAGEICGGEMEFGDGAGGGEGGDVEVWNGGECSGEEGVIGGGGVAGRWRVGEREEWEEEEEHGHGRERKGLGTEVLWRSS